MSGQVRVIRLARRNKRPNPKRPTRQVKAYVNKQIKNTGLLMKEYHPQVSSVNIGYDAPLVKLLTDPDVADVSTSSILLPKSIKVGFRLTNPASAGTVFVRVIFLQWFKRSSLVAPTIPTVLFRAAGANSILDQYNSTNLDKDEFRVIKDKVFTLGEATSVEGRESSAHKIFIKGKFLKHIHPNDVATEVLNGVYMLAFSNIAAASTPPTIISEGVFTTSIRNPA